MESYLKIFIVSSYFCCLAIYINEIYLPGSLIGWTFDPRNDIFFLFIH